MLMLIDYGPLKPILGGVTALSSITVVLIGGFRRRASWEPSSEDLPRLAQQLASIIISVCVAILFVEHSQFARRSTLELAAGGLAFSSFLLGMSYVFAVGMLTYVWNQANNTVRVLGGLWSREEIDKAIVADSRKLRILLEEGSPDFVNVWSRMSRQLSKVLIMVIYVMLLTCAGLALASAAMILVVQPPPDRPALGLLSFRVESPLQPGSPISIGVRFVNSGRTPARNVANAFVVTYLAGDPDNVGEPPDDAFTSSATVAPNVVFLVLAKSELPISKEGYDALSAGTSKIYVYGLIRYKDYEGNFYTTHFCAGYDFKTGDFPLCSNHNQSD
jgi:hypothetical protein